MPSEDQIDQIFLRLHFWFPSKSPQDQVLVQVLVSKNHPFSTITETWGRSRCTHLGPITRYALREATKSEHPPEAPVAASITDHWLVKKSRIAKIRY